MSEELRPYQQKIREWIDSPLPIRIYPRPSIGKVDISARRFGKSLVMRMMQEQEKNKERWDAMLRDMIDTQFMHSLSFENDRLEYRRIDPHDFYLHPSARA